MRDIIQNKLNMYDSSSSEEEENALKEISQEIILYALKESGFFEHAVFIGGTCLRIVHQLDSFSEDLDFSLIKKDPQFDFQFFVEKINEIMMLYGYQVTVDGEESADANIKSRFLKVESIKKMINFKHLQDLRKKMRIKVEIDVNPPDHSHIEPNYLDFPTDFMIMTHDLPSLMAGKCHALLCRSYVKGRDWYDFLWYIRSKVQLNKAMLEDALDQQGPWKGLSVKISDEWIIKNLESKIKNLDWEEAKRDVASFLKFDKKESLELWSEDFFLKKLKRIFP